MSENTSRPRRDALTVVVWDSTQQMSADLIPDVDTVMESTAVMTVTKSQKILKLQQPYYKRWDPQTGPKTLKRKKGSGKPHFLAKSKQKPRLVTHNLAEPHETRPQPRNNKDRSDQPPLQRTSTGFAPLHANYCRARRHCYF